MQKPFDWPAEVPLPTTPAMVRGLLALSRGMADDVRTLKAGSGLPAFIAAINTLGTYPALLAELAPTLSDISDAGDLAALDEVALSNLAAALQTSLTEQSDATWTTGTGTTASIIAPDALAAAIDARGGSVVGSWKAQAGANQSITTATNTALNQWSNFLVDTESVLSGTLTNLDTPSGATHADIILQIRFAANATGTRSAFIQYGTTGGTGNTFIGLDNRNTAATGVTYISIAAFTALTGGTDKISASVTQSSGGNLNVESSFTTISATFYDLS